MPVSEPIWQTLGQGTLKGNHVRLEPLRPDHIPGLERVFRPEILRHYTRPYASAREFVEENFENRDRGLLAPYAILLQSSGEPIGCTEFMAISQAHRKLEIGGSWLALEHQGTKANPEAKLLLFQEAFDRLGCIRVEFKTDSLNLQSQAAIAKLGAVREGVLRNHMIRADGTYRHSVYFSVTSEEWPAVRERIQTRLHSSLPSHQP